MKKWSNIIIGFFMSLFTIYFVAINFVNVVYFHRMAWTLNFGLLFFNDQSFIFFILTLIVVIVWSEIVLNNFFGKNRKRRLTHDEKRRTSHLAKFKEIKPNLIRLNFDDNNLVETYFDRALIRRNKKYKSLHSLEKSLQQNLKNLFKTNIPPKIPVLSRYNKKHPVLKKYKIGDKSTYKRAGLVFSGGHNYMYVDPNDSHTLVLGTSNSGKSWSLVLEMLEGCRMAGESVVVNDPKGELAKYMKAKFENDGYQCYILNFVDPEYSNAWNPFEMAIQEWIKAEELIKDDALKQMKDYEQDVAKCEILGLPKPKRPEPIKADYSKAIEIVMDVANTLCLEANPKDPIWTETARDMVAGAAIFLMECGKFDLVSFTNIRKLITEASKMITPDDAETYGISISKQTKLMRVYLDNYRNNDADSIKLLDSYLSSTDNTESSFFSSFINKINLVTQNKAVEKVLASNEIDLKSFGEKKTAVFLIVHDEKKTYYPISTMFVKQIYEALIKSARNEANLRLKVPLNMILDEFGNMPPVKDIDAMLTAARSRGIRITMIIQDFQQLNKQYGKEIATTIKGNVMNTVYLLAGADDTLEEISKSAGTEKVWNKDKKLYEDVRLFSKDRLKHFEMGEALFLSQRRHPYFTNLQPYDAYKFYKGGLESKFDYIEKPPIKYYDLADDFFNMGIENWAKDDSETNVIG
ncbi:type IV secretory system conjugative DNA transfer family protein [Thomasclavelia cocleata]|uniref:Type IV secretory system Conjugative DNA transfer n=1 Tax=Thomasclavelia cocleata TaxID=69824 RepID=A0A1I0CQ06_9FIRM|nr:type IV secretory system conjugative DNA transfer family protein [Thomasclavelia cocleata]MCR1960753.1 type IV secretory system conjugative DNA transfer family protein [Thomasclavelia cocleata]SET21304.1 Type IV secretory system Conjugative DNA transfer [Thomasclavelia cocleata]